MCAAYEDNFQWKSCLLRTSTARCRAADRFGAGTRPSKSLLTWRPGGATPPTLRPPADSGYCCYAARAPSPLDAGAGIASFGIRDLDDMAARVIAYRSSWMPQDQRRIERDMFAGVPAGIFTTSPLKLGIEVNALDASVGLFYYILLLHRQSGRASYAYQWRPAGWPTLLGQPGELFSYPHTAFSRRYRHICCCSRRTCSAPPTSCPCTQSLTRPTSAGWQRRWWLSVCCVTHSLVDAVMPPMPIPRPTLLLFSSRSAAPACRRASCTKQVAFSIVNPRLRCAPRHRRLRTCSAVCRVEVRRQRKWHAHHIGQRRLRVRAVGARVRQRPRHRHARALRQYNVSDTRCRWHAWPGCCASATQAGIPRRGPAAQRVG